MKSKPSPASIVFTILSLLFAAAYIVGCVLLHKFNEQVTIASYFITFAVFIAIFLIVKGRSGKEEVESDERTNKLVSKAYTHSWLITYFAVITLVSVDFLFPINLSWRSFAIFLMLFMAVSALISRAIMLRKGDVE
jgi:hypothetical protein